MIAAFAAAFSQLADPPVRAVIWRVALWTMAAYLALGALLWAVLASLAPMVSFEGITIDWIREALVWVAPFLIAVVGGLFFIALVWLLFVAVVHLVGGYYLERVIAAVEARHYPGLPAAKPPAAGPALAATLRFLGVLAILNGFALLVYWIPFVGVGVFFGINGYLFGREYFELVAMRRLDPAAAREMRRAQRGEVWRAGLIITGLMTVPVVNLAAPIVAAAAMVHVFENTATRLRRPFLRSSGTAAAEGGSGAQPSRRQVGHPAIPGADGAR